MSIQIPVHIEARENFWLCSYTAMASPCEILIELDAGNKGAIRQLAIIGYQEAKRIEQKYSRYRDDNIIHSINHANGKRINVDDETARLLDYADQLYQLSDGLFDITSGVLRRVWHFDGSDKLPNQQAIDAVLPLIGWPKVQWNKPAIALPPGMEIDFGGIGKEYAVDRTVQLLRAKTTKNFLVNYGGDLYATGPQSSGKGWIIGMDDPAHTGKQALATMELQNGGVATSGDARRFLLRDGIRYSHILDPRNGWPVAGAPHGITVLASTCTEAGMLATLAMLQGAGAKEFLQEQDVKFWCY